MCYELHLYAVLLGNQIWWFGSSRLYACIYHRQIKVCQYFLHTYIMHGDTVPNRQIPRFLLKLIRISYKERTKVGGANLVLSDVTRADVHSMHVH